MKFFNLLIALIALGFFKGQAQVSYNKKAIGAIGDAPKVGSFLNDASLETVDMATGALKVGIPLYEIKVNDISVPISINYTAMGLKVGQEASPVGMGWELSAGGKIITNVQGKTDSPAGTNLYSGIYTSIVSDPSTFDAYVAHRTLAAGIVDGTLDGAWDTYSYVLPNGGGTYVKNGLTFPYDPQITIQHPGKIKTSDGLVYNFVPGDVKQSKKRTYYEPYTTTITYIGDSTFTRDPKTSSWNDQDLSNIISTRFKDTVFFDYTYITDPARLALKARKNTSETLPLYRNVLQEGIIYKELANRFYDIQQPILAQSKTEYTTHSRLKKIRFANGDVRFIYGNDILGRDVLTEINIYQKIGADSTLLKKYEFNYDTNLDYGHYLQSIDIYDSKNVKVGKWSFDYYSKLPLNPTLESKAQDRWGFYNLQSNNKTLLESPDKMLPLRLRQYLPVRNGEYDTNKSIEYSRPEATEFYGLNNGSLGGNNYYTYSIPFANRDFNFSGALMGTLKSVKMPTGASVEYEYEPHKFRKSVMIAGYATSTEFTGGGIRIKSITKSMKHDSLYTYSADMKILKKTYTYGEGEYASSGQPVENNGFGNVTMPGTVVTNTSRYHRTTQSGTDFDIVNMNLLSHAINNMVQYNGSYAIYKSVSEETVTDDGGMSFGKTVYYNNVPTLADRPDFAWQADNGVVSTLDRINLPVTNANPGVRKELIAGTYGIKKYAYKGAEGYKTVEETKYTFKSFSAPQNSQNKLLSLFITVAAQISGPWNYTTTEIKDSGESSIRGGITVMLFNATKSSSNFGLMDYLAMTNLAQEENVALFPDKYISQIFDLATLSNCIRKVKEETTKFDDNGLTMAMTDTKYDYRNLIHLLPTRVATKDSKGDSIIIRKRYPQDYSVNSYPPIGTMISNRVGLSEPIEEFINYKSAGTEYIRQGIINTFKFHENGLVPEATYKMYLPGQTAYSNSAYYSAGLTPDPAIFKQTMFYNMYAKGNVTKYIDERNSSTGIIWGYNNQYPIAKIFNVDDGTYAPVDSVAFSNFESEDKGNWVYSGQPVVDTTSPFGKRIYSLSNGDITRPGYASSGRFVLSYWQKSGANVSVTGGTSGPVQIKNAKAGWTLMEREVSNLTTTLKISGTGYIDELRFYPIGSLMTTYNYNPLIGLTSIIDPKGKIQYYDYDDSQRLKNIRDQDGNIIKSYKYILSASN